MISTRSLADFNGSSPGGPVTGGHRRSCRPSLNLRDDMTSGGWGLLPGHHRGPTAGDTRGLSHGHGHALPSMGGSPTPGSPQEAQNT